MNCWAELIVLWLPELAREANWVCVSANGGLSARGFGINSRPELIGPMAAEMGPP